MGHTPNKAGDLILALETQFQPNGDELDVSPSCVSDDGTFAAGNPKQDCIHLRN